jgi:tryptophan synthase beta chain
VCIRDRTARRTGRPRAALPDADHPAGGLDGPADHDPGGGALRLPAVAADPALPGTPTEKAPRDAGRAFTTSTRAVSPTGSHKRNTAVAQAYYQQAGGRTRGSRPRPGAGQWGSALAFAGGIFGLEVDVWMVKVSYDQKPYRRGLIEAFGARVVASPSEETNAGRAILAEHPTRAGASASPSRRRSRRRRPRRHEVLARLVLNHVLMHQTVIGEEAQMQMDEAEDYPDVLIGCTGGGSNFSGLSFPFIGARCARRRRSASSPVSPPRVPSLTKGPVRVRLRRHGASHAAREDAHARLDVRPASVPRGRLRYHGWRRW